MLKFASRYDDLTAETQNYGTRTLIDKSLGNGVTRLSSPDDNIRIYDFNSFGGFLCQNSSFDDSLIPTTTNGTEWPTSDASLGATQALYSATLINDILFNDFDIEFDGLQIGVDCRFNNAGASGTPTSIPRVTIGLIDGASLAVHDIIGHELGHIAIRPNLSSNGSQSGSLHEGIADMFGTYVEAVIQMGENEAPDWIIGDDVDGGEELFHRNLADTINNCFINLEDETSKHLRSEPLGHWFYLLSQGSLHVNPLGMKETLNLVLETLPHISSTNSDYPELRDAMVTMVENTYGTCSTEAIAVTNAWHQICVGEASTCFKIDGPEEVCEEDDFLQFYVTNPQPGTLYRWTFPIEWTISNNSTQQGNTITDTYLRVVGLPQYDYYPQHFTVKVYSPLLGVSHTQTKQVTIIDCDGDDPTCFDYLENYAIIENRSSDELREDDIVNISIYNIYGQLIYQGLESNFSQKETEYTQGIYVFCYFNKYRELIKSEKRVLVVY